MQPAQRVFVISDTHFSHGNIIEYENRPFTNTDEMDGALVEKWNNVVKEDDLVFHIGDVTFAGADKAKEQLTRLKGRKILILGNHDRFTKTKWRLLGFDPYLYYFYQGYLMTHIPMQEEPLRAAIAHGMMIGNIHGHTHSKDQHLSKDIYRNASVERHDYTPVLFDHLVGTERKTDPS